MTLLALLALSAPAHSAPPVDADGAFVHVATVPLDNVRSPNPLKRAMADKMVAGWDREGGLFLLYGNAELVYIGPDGRFHRDRYDAVDLNTLGVLGRFVVEDGGLTYYEMPHGVRRVDLTTGAVTPALADPSAPKAYELIRTGGRHAASWWIRDMATRTASQWTGSAWGPPVKLEPNRHGNVVKEGLQITPCGQLRDGTPITTWYDFETRAVYIGTVNADLRVADTLWSTPVPLESWNARMYSNALGCDVLGDRVQIGLMNQVFVWDGQTLVSALRAGAGESEMPEYNAVGPYAFQALHTTRLLGDGDILVAIDRRGVEVKIFAERLDSPKKALARAEKEDDPLLALRAGVTGDARYQALWDLSWWELLEEEARAAGDLAWADRAFARKVVKWAQRGAPAEVFMGPGRMEQMDGPLLEKVEEGLTRNPKDAWSLYARALLLRRLDRATDADAALSALDAALPAPGLTAADVPELFDLAAARGDVARMKAMLGTVDAASRPRIHALWTARIARVDGRTDDGLAALKGLDRDDFDGVVLTAQLQADSGALDAAIATWMRAAGQRPDDPIVQAGLGVAYLQRGLTELAVEALVKAVEGDPSTAAHKSNLAAALTALDKKQDALKQLYAALGDAPDDALLQHQLQTAMGQAAGAGTGGDVAVLPFTVAGGSVERVGLGDMIGSMASTRLVNAGVGVVERSRVDAIFAEQDLQRTARVDPKTAVQMGKVAGARWIVTGTVSEFVGASGSTELVLDVRRVDVQSGKVAAAASGRAPLEVGPLEAALDAAVAKVKP
jgi:tetratricopeptide (TPR) repeat protein